ncbi:MAG: ABC transporter ATP-binding protein [Ruminococcaceae bacterium]|nr:ABC transporter ATP-binding protein [Oscillospiraceae bacterium]
MIKIDGVSKRYDNRVQSLKNVTLNIKKGSVLGLIGTNGAGKSTLLRIMSGIFKSDKGDVYIDGERVFENDRIKAKVTFVSDEQYLIPHFTLTDMAKLYSRFYPNFSKEKFEKMCHDINLDTHRKISTFSKGMKRQGEVILSICSGSDYLFFDETFDGLDPIARDYAKRMIADTVAESGRTVVLSSHNLSDIETICDSVCLIDGGELILHKTIDDIVAGWHKYQMIFSTPLESVEIIENFATLPQISGKLLTFISSLEEEEVSKKMKLILGDNKIIYSECVPLTLEEIFTLEVKRVKEKAGDRK